MNSEKLNNIAFLALGSNLGDARKNIISAINKLQKYNIKITSIAPFYKNIPIIPIDAKEDYQNIFYNTVIKIKIDLTPIELLNLCKKIEEKMGRKSEHEKWTPRIIDIDILLYNDLFLTTKELKIPHPEALNRSFVLDPLMQIDSDLEINKQKILNISRNHKSHIPTIMGIINITNDSFSGDGMLQTDIKKIEKKIKKWIKNAIPIIDIGAQSTRPNAKQITPKEEIKRLTPIFKIIEKYKNNYTTKFSIDTYNFETAKIAIDNGFKIINDVSGFHDERMWELIQNNEIETVLMHNLTIPADKNITMKANCNIINEIQNWAEKIIHKCEKHRIKLSKIILDPGIGFGKTAEQSITIMKNLKELQNLPMRILIGHSKKSFINHLEKQKNPKKRLLNTILISLTLKENGVDIIRTHDPIEHKNAFFFHTSLLKK